MGTNWVRIGYGMVGTVRYACIYAYRTVPTVPGEGCNWPRFGGWSTWARNNYSRVAMDGAAAVPLNTAATRLFMTFKGVERCISLTK